MKYKEGVPDIFKEEYTKEYEQIFEAAPEESFFKKLIEDYERNEENKE